MSEFTEVTADNLRFVRGSKGLNQDDVGQILGLHGNQISKIEKGLRALSDSEKKLLDWYFFGVLPKRITTFPADLKGILEFDEAEWKIIGTLAARDGFPSQRPWITKKIRDYLAVYDDASKPEAVPANVLPFVITRHGSVAAGGKSSADVEETEIPVGKQYKSDHYALRVLGRSMEPTIPDGSIIIVKAFKDQGFPRKGSIVVYNDGYGTTLKVFDYEKAKADDEHARMGKIPVLKSINPEFPDVEPLEGGRIDAVFVEVLEQP